MCYLQIFPSLISSKDYCLFISYPSAKTQLNSYCFHFSFTLSTRDYRKTYSHIPYLCHVVVYCLVLFISHTSWSEISPQPAEFMYYISVELASSFELCAQCWTHSGCLVNTCEVCTCSFLVYRIWCFFILLIRHIPN